MKNYLTIDVEDYFQVAALSDVIDRSDWDGMDQRVCANTRPLLRVLREHGVRATFFIVGWVAEKYPGLVREILADNHDIGCHSYWHRKIHDLSPEEFAEDTRRAKKVLEEIAGRKVVCYRAPSYSITRQTLWALEILKAAGFTTDSSIFPIRHDIYGMPGAPRFPYRLSPSGLAEYPISTVILGGRTIPVSGGGYFRLFPYWFTKFALKRINDKEKQPFVFYLHPWEIDDNQPRFKQARMLSKFRHYTNLDKTMNRFTRLLTDFEFGPLPEDGKSVGNVLPEESARVTN